VSSHGLRGGGGGGGHLVLIERYLQQRAQGGFQGRPPPAHDGAREAAHHPALVPQQAADGPGDVGGRQHGRRHRDHPQRLERLGHRHVEQTAELLRSAAVRGVAVAEQLHDFASHLPVLVPGAALRSGGLDGGVDGAERREEGLPPPERALIRHRSRTAAAAALFSLDR